MPPLQPIPEPQLRAPAAAVNIIADEQRNSLIFSTEELKKEYYRLKVVSKDWTRKEQEDIRKTTNHLVLSSPERHLQGDNAAARDNRKTLLPERKAINDLGKNLLRLSLDYNGQAESGRKQTAMIASVGNLKPAQISRQH